MVNLFFEGAHVHETQTIVTKVFSTLKNAENFTSVSISLTEIFNFGLMTFNNNFFVKLYLKKITVDEKLRSIYW